MIVFFCIMKERVSVNSLLAHAETFSSGDIHLALLNTFLRLVISFLDFKLTPTSVTGDLTSNTHSLSLSLSLQQVALI